LLGERWGMTNTLAALAEVADRRGDRARSVALIDEALGLAEELGSTVDTADLLRLRGDVGVRAGDLDGAAADYRLARSHARRAGALDNLAAARLGLAEVARLRGDLAEARRQAETGLAECPAGWFTADETRSDLLVALGRIAEAEGDPAGARDHYRQSLAISTGIPSLLAPTGALAGLLRLAQAAAGDHAAVLLGAAAALVGPAGDAALAGTAEQVRARLGDRAYEAAYARGAALPRDQALSLLGGSRSATRA
jgi:tetratricopeptide (TPR) repeat protein